MTSSCPQCGTHLSIVRVQDASDATTYTALPAPQQHDSGQSSDADLSYPNLGSGKDNRDVEKNDDLGSKKDHSDRTQLSRLICMCLSYEFGEVATYPGYPTFRQSLRVGHVGHVKAGRPRETLDATVVKMHDAIYRVGEGSVDKLLASRRFSWSAKHWPDVAEKVFQAIGAIVYDMEWTSDHGELQIKNAEALADAKNTISPNFKVDYTVCLTILEHMLLTDYYQFPPSPIFPHSPDSALSGDELDALWFFERFASFLTAAAWRWRQGCAIPDLEAWDLIVGMLEGGGTWSKGYFTWDAAIMFYHYHSRRKPVCPEARRQGFTGYTGVLQEMFAEIPTRGKDRLQRKLSVDVHHFIPNVVGNPKRREHMIGIARNLASSCGCELGLRSTPPVPSAVAAPAPLPVPLPLDTAWRGWFDRLFRFPSRRIRLEDEENQGGGGKKVG